jgi:hypothetical protein
VLVGITNERWNQAIGSGDRIRNWIEVLGFQRKGYSPFIAPSLIKSICDFILLRGVGLGV